MAWLTKSRFLAGRQCLKRLWSEIHAPITEPQADSLPLINGRAVDQLVRRLYPGPVIPRTNGMPAAIADTTRLLSTQAPPVVHQPAFRAGNLAVIADMLRQEQGGFTLIEVKASTSVKPEHLPDVGYQTLVLRQARVPVNDIRLAHVNNQFILRELGNYTGLIIEEDVTAQVEAALREIADDATRYLAVMDAKVAPRIPIGDHCNAPYDCPFIERCQTEAGPQPLFPVSVLPRGGSTAAALIRDGFDDLVTVPPERLTTDTHRRVHEATITGKPFFDPAPTLELRTHAYPRSYLDFETMGYAVPQFIGSHPYEQLPFQYSLHVEYSAADIRHHERLDQLSFGDFESFALQLVADMPATGPIYAYNAAFEKRVLLWLASVLPGHAAALTSMTNRLVDLWPITQAAYYHRDMRGSWSIKAVMPTIAPELDYSNLDGVQDGGGAQLALIEAGRPDTTPERRAELTRSLLTYCKQDTWSMVVLRRFLCEEHAPIAHTQSPG